MDNNFTTIKIEIIHHVAHLRLNRPDKLNAINYVMLQELSKAIDLLEENHEIRCLLISGEGRRAFSSGADITEFKKFTTEKAKELSIKGQQVCAKIENMSKPVFAAINGYALGGGLELAMACDFRVASVDSQFGFPEIKLGLIPGWGGTVRLPLLVGKTKSKQLITSGEYINAQEALKIGLVDNVFSGEKFEKKTFSIAQRLCECPPSTDNKLKKTISNSLGPALNNETEVFAHRFSLPETKNKFIERASQRNKK